MEIYFESDLYIYNIVVLVDWKMVDWSVVMMTCKSGCLAPVDHGENRTQNTENTENTVGVVIVTGQGYIVGVYVLPPSLKIT